MLLNILVPLYFLSQAFEQAKKSPGRIFGTTGDIDIEKIRNSKYFQALVKQSKEKDENQLVRHADNHTVFKINLFIVQFNFLLFSVLPDS